MKKILVIEDEPSVRANILEILEEDYHGIGAENGLIGVLWAAPRKKIWCLKTRN